MRLAIIHYIDEYEKQPNGKLKRIWRYKTEDENEYLTIKYNLQDRIIQTYTKVKQI